MGTRKQPVRPRFGQLQRADGTLAAVVFHVADGDPDGFVARHADTYEPVTLMEGDRISVDGIRAGQTLLFQAPPDWTPARGAPVAPRVDLTPRPGLLTRLWRRLR